MTLSTKQRIYCFLVVMGGGYYNYVDVLYMKLRDANKIVRLTLLDSVIIGVNICCEYI